MRFIAASLLVFTCFTGGDVKIRKIEVCKYDLKVKEPVNFLIKKEDLEKLEDGWNCLSVTNFDKNGVLRELKVEAVYFIKVEDKK